MRDSSVSGLELITRVLAPEVTASSLLSRVSRQLGSICHSATLGGWDERVGGEANCVKDRDESKTMREDPVTQLCHAQHHVTQPDH